MLKMIHQYLAVYVFVALAIIGIIEKDWNFGVGLNISLVFLYVFLYLQPIK